MLLVSFSTVFLILLSLDKSTTALSGGSSTDLKTPDPINIIPDRVERIFTPLPLIVLLSFFDNILVKNTGHSVRLIENDPVSGNILTGGVLGLEKYVYGETIFYWADRSDGVAYTTVGDEIRAPLVICVLYYNIRYRSFNDALNYRNGIAKICNPINVGPIENPLFNKFAPSLEKIQEPKSSVRTKLLPAFLFYASIIPIETYYAYHGSTEDETGKIYYCTTTIITPQFPFHFISEKQFNDTFLSFRDSDGKKLVNNPQPVPQGMRKVVKTAGFVVIPNPIKIPTKMGSQ